MSTSTYLLIALAVIALVVVVCLVVKKNRTAPKAEQAAESTGSAADAEIAANILSAMGGKENVAKLDYCTTRLRFELKDYRKVDEAAVKAAGATSIIRSGKTTCQAIMGTRVKAVYGELQKLL